MLKMKTVPVLFCTSNSIYKKLGCDVYDLKRNALKFTGNSPVIAHPPCSQWSRLRYFSKRRVVHKMFALWAVELIRLNGGVLEHPMGSSLWLFLNLPRPGHIDNFGGFSICVNQSWFGHPYRKSTMLYIVGLSPSEIPDYSPNFIPTKKNVSKARKWRTATPVKFAEFLIQIQKKIHEKQTSVPR